MTIERHKPIYGSNITEAWSDASSYDPETRVNIPSEEAVEDAKEWVDNNEL